MPSRPSQSDHITLRLPKSSGLKAQLHQQAELRGESVNTYILRAIEARLQSSSCRLDGPDHSGVRGWNSAEKR